MTENEKKEFLRDGVEVPLALKNGKLTPEQIDKQINK